MMTDPKEGSSIYNSESFVNIVYTRLAYKIQQEAGDIFDIEIAKQNKIPEDDTLDDLLTELRESLNNRLSLDLKAHNATATLDTTLGEIGYPEFGITYRDLFNRDFLFKTDNETLTKSIVSAIIKADQNAQDINMTANKKKRLMPQEEVPVISHYYNTFIFSLLAYEWENIDLNILSLENRTFVDNVKAIRRILIGEIQTAHGMGENNLLSSSIAVQRNFELSLLARSLTTACNYTEGDVKSVSSGIVRNFRRRGMEDYLDKVMVFKTYASREASKRAAMSFLDENIGAALNNNFNYNEDANKRALHLLSREFIALFPELISFLNAREDNEILIGTKSHPLMDIIGAESIKFLLREGEIGFLIEFTNGKRIMETLDPLTLSNSSWVSEYSSEQNVSEMATMLYASAVMAVIIDLYTGINSQDQFVNKDLLKKKHLHVNDLPLSNQITRLEKKSKGTKKKKTVVSEKSVAQAQNEPVLVSIGGVTYRLSDTVLQGYSSRMNSLFFKVISKIMPERSSNYSFRQQGPSQEYLPQDLHELIQKFP